MIDYLIILIDSFQWQSQEIHHHLHQTILYSYSLIAGSIWTTKWKMRNFYIWILYSIQDWNCSSKCCGWKHQIFRSWKIKVYSLKTRIYLYWSLWCSLINMIGRVLFLLSIVFIVISVGTDHENNSNTALLSSRLKTIWRKTEYNDLGNLKLEGIYSKPLWRHIFREYFDVPDWLAEQKFRQCDVDQDGIISGLETQCFWLSTYITSQVKLHIYCILFFYG